MLSEVKNTELFGEELGRRVFLRPHWGKCLFLSGDLGIGKTALLRGFSRGLGVRENVASPSYALMSEYSLPENSHGLTTFSHADVYRTEEGSALGLSEIVEKITDPKTVLAVEWAEKIPTAFFPEKYIFLRMKLASDEIQREIDIHFHDAGIPSDAEIGTIIRELQTPIHVQEHIEKVTRVALFLANRLIQNGLPVDVLLVRAAALLHDALRIINFSEIQEEKFHEEVTLKKRALWEAQIKKYSSQHHAFAMGSFLREKGYIAVADVLEKHCTRAILEEMTLEEQCMYLADRSVMGNKIVGVTKRFLEAARRNGHEESPDFEKIRERVFLLEKELFKKAKITSEDISDLDSSSSQK